jgi:prophage tail gpP-like protein
MPTVATDLVGPLGEMQLDAYGRARIPVEDVNAAEVIADALESVAEHWLKR